MPANLVGHGKVMCKICCKTIDEIYEEEKAKDLRKSYVLKTLHELYDECDDIDVAIEIERAIDRIT